ncbi:WLM-domain-containing protein, partial [Martensiomyces pterosporus]
LKKQPYSEEALSMLQRITAQVRPVMQSRSWRVATLCEFYPRDAALQGQNINRGQEVRLCLRNPHDPYQFLRFNDVLGTMLHELAHIEHGAHDEKFYKLLDELKSETEGLMAQGYTGDGFFSIGLRVGLGHSHNAPWHQLREKTLRAVEARQKKQMFAAGPPRALAGGAGRSSGSDWRRLETTHSPAQMAAIALERRMRDERRC